MSYFYSLSKLYSTLFFLDLHTNITVCPFPTYMSSLNTQCFFYVFPKLGKSHYSWFCILYLPIYFLVLAMFIHIHEYLLFQIVFYQMILPQCINIVHVGDFQIVFNLHSYKHISPNIIVYTYWCTNAECSFFFLMKSRHRISGF